MLTLREMTDQEKELQALFEAEIIDEQTFKDTTESLGAETKIESICKVIRNLEAEAKALKAEGNSIVKKGKSAEGRAVWLEQYVIEHLQSTGKTKIKAGIYNVSIRSSTAVDIIDESKVPGEYVIPQPPTVDKKSIGDKLRNGEVVAGAALKHNKSLQIK